MTRSKFIMLMALTILMFSGYARSNKDNSSSQNSQTSVEEQSSSEEQETSALNEFFSEVSADQPKDEVLEAAKKKKLKIDSRNTDTGSRIYTITESGKEGKSLVLSYNALHDDALEEMTYIDKDEAIEGHWSPTKGYVVADHNYPQALYTDPETSTVSNFFPVNSAAEVIDFQLTK